MDQTDGPILIVEDEALIAFDLAATLEEDGFASVAIAGSVLEALAAIDRRRPTAAALDFNLGREDSTPVALRLHELGVPFVVLTGSLIRAGELARLARQVISKPVPAGIFLRAMRRCRAPA